MARPPARPPSKAARAYTQAIAHSAATTTTRTRTGAGDPVPALRAEEANLRHALDLARARQHWDDAVGCLQGLRVLYERTGRDGDGPAWLSSHPGFHRPRHGRAAARPRRRLEPHYRLPGPAGEGARDWPAATPCKTPSSPGTGTRPPPRWPPPPASSPPASATRSATSLCPATSSATSSLQVDPGCLPHYEEALRLCQQIGARMRKPTWS